MASEGQRIYAHPTGDILLITNFISETEEARLLASLYGAGNSMAADEAEETAPRLPWVQLSRRRLLNLGGTPGSSDTSTTVVRASVMVPEPLPRWALEPVGQRLLSVSAALEKRTSVLGQPSPSSADILKGENTSPADETSLVNAVARVLSQCPSTSPATYRLVSSAINHILVNEYLKPNGILGHEDGPQYEPIVSIVSAESAVMLKFESKEWRRARGEAAVAARHNQQPTTQEPPVASEPPKGALVELFLPPRSLVLFRGAFYTDYLHSVPECEADEYHGDLCLNYEEVLRYIGYSTLDTNAAAATVPATASVPRGHRRVSFTYRRVLAVAKLSAAALFGRRR